MATIESISLYFKEGSSDKFYQAAIESEPIEGDYRVTFVYGRVGTSGTAGTKVIGYSFENAKKVYDKLVKEKIDKGYKIQNISSTEGYSYSVPLTDKIDTGIRPQLLTPISEEEVINYIKNPDFIAQEKYDGRRKFFDKQKDKIISINRKGQEVGYPTVLADSLLGLDRPNLLLDGEEEGNIFYVFDLLRIGNMDISSYQYIERYNHLIDIIGIDEHIRLVPIYETEKDKLELFRRLKEEGKEGIVFKNKTSIYTSGRSRNQVKFKFYNTASCIVLKVNDKRSIQLGLIEGENIIFVGNCTLPSNYNIPIVGSIVEIRYLYAYRGGSLYQPIYQGSRNDIHENDCIIAQLKYKIENEED